MDFQLLGKHSETITAPDRAILDTFPNRYQERDYVITFDSEDFTSLCPVTGQPDFAEISIRYIPGELCIETKSLKYYLHAFRNTQAFNEQIINDMLADFVAACKPKWMQIKGAFAARGGISLTTIVEYPELDLETLKKTL